MAKKVIVYSTPTCPYCVMAKQYLKDHNIIFSDVNVADDEIGAKEMIAKSGQMGVPVIVVSDTDNAKEEVIIGFDQGRLKAIML